MSLSAGAGPGASPPAEQADTGAAPRASADSPPQSEKPAPEPVRIVAIIVACGALLLVGAFAGGVLRRWVGAGRPASGFPAGSAFSPAAPEGTPAPLYRGEEGRALPGQVPPPPESQLLFAQPGVSGGATAYRYASGIAISEVVAYYRRQMVGAGWRELPESSRAYSEEYPGEILYFQKAPQRQCLIAVSSGEQGRTMVTVIAN